MGVLEWVQRILVGDDGPLPVAKKKKKAKTAASMSASRKKRKVAMLIERDGDRCWFCWRLFDSSLKRTIDHMIPIAAGGTNKLDNLVLSCYPCNQIKGARIRQYEPGCFRNLYR